MGLEDIKNIVVVGAGLMGNQIAELFARVGGYSVVMVDIKEDLVANGIEAISKRLESFFVVKGQMSAREKMEVLGRIGGSVNIEEAAKNADFTIESATENMDIKKDIFTKVDSNAPAATILASNTSYLNITEMGSVTGRPDKVVGMHFFNPVARMKLVEIIRSPLTSDETLETVKALAVKLGKETVVCSDASFGFLANRLYLPMRLEAVQMVWEWVASPADIDKAARLAFNFPMGPLELGDMVGSWGIYAASEQDRIRELGEDKGRLHPLLRQMVRAGYTGGAGKKGIYDFWKDVLAKR